MYLWGLPNLHTVHHCLQFLTYLSHACIHHGRFQFLHFLPLLFTPTDGPWGYARGYGNVSCSTATASKAESLSLQFVANTRGAHCGTLLGNKKRKSVEQNGHGLSYYKQACPTSNHDVCPTS